MNDRMRLLLGMNLPNYLFFSGHCAYTFYCNNTDGCKVFQMSVLISIISYKSIFHGKNHVVAHRSDGLYFICIKQGSERAGCQYIWTDQISHVCRLCGWPLKFEF